MEGEGERQAARRAKRGLDLVVATAACVLLAPVWIAVALAILITDGRPVLFRQTRVGFGGRTFTMYKFRTMVRDAHARVGDLADRNERGGPLFKVDDDPRVTSVGRLLRRSSLDELPQLWNVVAGDMSLVGPRPALPEEREQFSAELRRREAVPQGMTGLWQVEARQVGDFGVYQALDLDYVQNWTLRRDLWLMVRTPIAVLAHALPRRRGAEVAPPARAAEAAPVVGDRVVDLVPAHPTVRVVPVHRPAPRTGTPRTSTQLAGAFPGDD